MVESSHTFLLTARNFPCIVLLDFFVVRICRMETVAQPLPVSYWRVLSKPSSRATPFPKDIIISTITISTITVFAGRAALSEDPDVVFGHMTNFSV